jgi:hypothetical protein
MAVRRARGLAAVLLLGAAATGAADPPGLPERRVGDTWVRSHGLVVSVVQAGPEGTVERGHMRSCPGCLSHFDREGNYTGRITDPEGHPVDVSRLPGALVGGGWRFFAWPLEVGRTWLFSGTGYVDGELVRVFVTAQVRAREPVETAAGRFDAFRIHYAWERRDPAGKRLSWTTTSWYAPAARHVVRFTTTSPTGEEWELVDYKLR